MDVVRTIKKPVVKYNLKETYRVMVGMNAIIFPIDHPSKFVSNKSMCETSRVLNIDGHTFETENTIYEGVEV